MKILMLSSTFPYPPSRGGTEIRTFNLLKYLHKHHHVTLVTQRHKQVSDAEVETLRNYVSELVIFPLADDSHSETGLSGLLNKVTRFGRSLIRMTPPNVLHRYSPLMQAWVDAFVQAGKCDVITCEHSVNEIYIRPKFRHKVTTVVDVHSSVYGWTRNHLDMGASSNPLRDRLYLSILYNYEQRYCAKFSKIVVTTEEDRQQLLQFKPNAEIPIIPNGVDLELFPYRPKDAGGHKLIFVGAMDASHNIDAARFFAVEVLPKLQEIYPDTIFTIAGARPTQEILTLSDRTGVIVTGKVPSMVDCLHAATICVVPLRTGFGIKNKTLEAMAAGVPVVASDRGLEGLTVDGDGVPLRALRANRVEEYIDAISRLFENPQLREKLSLNGRTLIEAEYTWERAASCYEQVLLGKI